METAFDASERPLCRITVGPSPSSTDFAQMFAQYEDELARGQRFSVLANASATTRLELEQVKMLAQFGEDNHALLESFVDALAIVVPSAMVRGALKVAFQIKAPPHPYAVVKSIAEAEDFLAPYVEQRSS